LTITSSVVEFEMCKRLAWTGAIVGSSYHSWYLEEIEDGKCHVITEEVQDGMFQKFGGYFIQKTLESNHQKWLEGLDKMAKIGPP